MRCQMLINFIQRRKQRFKRFFIGFLRGRKTTTIYPIVDVGIDELIPLINHCAQRLRVIIGLIAR
ncbi:Uncharacterised protein [Vibrio cholerae]|uniref:Uncharacterized protein n=1 Tax=Vibrio cholerae TaxID=666 RepID=A0A655XGQ4_VIBCL|nr:Uncharacterised protein [Vibrio cholerae]CRZ93374.1 Uncharacterised protein [Vibrio cholerae]CSB38757.1 Uncharacterised protein [Vibrio cholerae]CSB42186.1 Uncharacterised protein [Vibrio cholerae]CSB46557.1 Uncharacterised protein [Vibrio cholerae]